MNDEDVAAAIVRLLQNLAELQKLCLEWLAHLDERSAALERSVAAASSNQETP